MKNIIIKCLFVVFFLNACVSSQKMAYDECDQSNFDREPNALKCESLFFLRNNDPELESKRPITVPEADINQQALENYDSPNIHALKAWNHLRGRSVEVTSLESLNKHIRRLLQDESLSVYHMFLESIAVSVNVKKENGETGDLELLKKSTYEVLRKILPEHMAQERSELILKSKLTYNDLLLALGKLTHKQSLEALVGKKGIREIDPNSLIGQYITQSKEKFGVDVKTLVTTFKQGPRKGGRGPEKLFIAVNRNTISLIANILQDPHHLFHDYSLGQGTLQLAHRGQNISYAQYNNDNISQYSDGFGVQGFAEGKLLPLINLSSIEASNATNYFTLGKLAGSKFSKLPWGYKDVDPNNPQKMENYCRTGGYSCCTHWVGEAPIGETFVTEYSFPGAVDKYGRREDGGSRKKGDDSKDLRTAPVGKYTHFGYNGSYQEIGTVTRNHRLSRIVWTQEKGRQQLWDMVGDTGADAYRQAEWVNPGWVLYSFLTKTSELKVPLVFVLKEDASDLSVKYLDRLTKSISHY